MECKTLERYDENGKQVLKPKKQFERLDDAIKAAKFENARPERFKKVVAYKCGECHKYHLGRNGNGITEKERLKYQKEMKFKRPTVERQENLKVVGFIDLTKIRY